MYRVSFKPTELSTKWLARGPSGPGPSGPASTSLLETRTEWSGTEQSSKQELSAGTHWLNVGVRAV